jgi:NAD-dependent DNA ligase
VLRFANDPIMQRICETLHFHGVQPKSIGAIAAVEGSPLAGVAFCITGELDDFGSRDYVTAKLVSLGAVSKSGVTSKVTHLIVGSEAGKSKLAKAETLRIQQVGSEWLEEIFEKYGLQKAGSSFALDDAE